MLLTALALCVACSGPEQQQPEGTTVTATETTSVVAAPPQLATAQSAAELIQAAVPEAIELIEVTEDNDPNNLIGRPNGYLAASVLVDSRLPRCTKVSSDCGVMIEQWPDQAAAQNRSDYIQSMLREMPMLGHEWNTVKGGLLLRVDGELKPSEADAYEMAFKG